MPIRSWPAGADRRVVDAVLARNVPSPALPAGRSHRLRVAVGAPLVAASGPLPRAPSLRAARPAAFSLSRLFPPLVAPPAGPAGPPWARCLAFVGALLPVAAVPRPASGVPARGPFRSRFRHRLRRAAPGFAAAFAVPPSAALRSRRCPSASAAASASAPGRGPAVRAAAGLAPLPGGRFPRCPPPRACWVPAVPGRVLLSPRLVRPGVASRRLCPRPAAPVQPSGFRAVRAAGLRRAGDRLPAALRLPRRRSPFALAVCRSLAPLSPPARLRWRASLARTAAPPPSVVACPAASRLSCRTSSPPFFLPPPLYSPPPPLPSSLPAPPRGAMDEVWPSRTTARR